VSDALTRRGFLCLSGATVAALAGCGGGGGGGEGSDPAPAGTPLACALRPLYAETDQVRGFAERYLAQAQTTVDAAQDHLRRTAEIRGLDASATATEAVAGALHDAIRDEFASGASLLVDGWIVSPSEANLAAAALARPTPC